MFSSHTIQTFWISQIWNNTTTNKVTIIILFIQKGHIKLIKSDSKDTNNVTKYLYFIGVMLCDF